MEKNLNIDVAALDPPHRQALEEVIGRELATNQRLIISIAEVDVTPTDDTKPPQTLADWTRVYEGLSDEEVEEVDQVVKTRADLTRNVSD